MKTTSKTIWTVVIENTLREEHDSYLEASRDFLETALKNPDCLVTLEITTTATTEVDRRGE